MHRLLRRNQQISIFVADTAIIKKGFHQSYAGTIIKVSVVSWFIIMWYCNWYEHMYYQDLYCYRLTQIRRQCEMRQILLKVSTLNSLEYLNQWESLVLCVEGDKIGILHVSTKCRRNANIKLKFLLWQTIIMFLGILNTMDVCMQWLSSQRTWHKTLTIDRNRYYLDIFDWLLRSCQHHIKQECWNPVNTM